MRRPRNGREGKERLWTHQTERCFVAWVDYDRGVDSQRFICTIISERSVFNYVVLWSILEAEIGFMVSLCNRRRGVCGLSCAQLNWAILPEVKTRNPCLKFSLTKPDQVLLFHSDKNTCLFVVSNQVRAFGTVVNTEKFLLRIMYIKISFASLTILFGIAHRFDQSCLDMKVNDAL